MYNRPSWDTLFMSMAYLYAYHSEDDSTKVGAVITQKDHTPIMFGYNGLPRGLPHLTEYLERPAKYDFMEHAERNALYNGLRSGIRGDVAHTLYVTWLPCPDCTRAVLQALNLKRVVVHRQGQDAFDSSKANRGADSVGVWDHSHGICDVMFSARDVEFIWYDGPIIGGLQGFFSGKIFDFESFTYEGNL